MKKVTLQLENVSGEVQEEKEIFISNNDLLVMRYSETTSLENAQKAFEVIEKGLKTGGVVGVPQGIALTLIKNNT